MLQTLKNAWKIPELKSKLLFTLMIIVLYRLGASIPMPWISSVALDSFANQTMTTGVMSWLNTLSGGAMGQATLFALSVSPYITSSIVIQLLTIAIPKFEEWAKEGEAGKKKLSAITRGLTVALALIQSIGYMMLLESWNIMTYLDYKTWQMWVCRVVLVLVYCAGASVVMWLAERINEKGIGNGISIILFANILSGLPMMFYNLFNLCFQKGGITAQNADGEVIQRGLGALFTEVENGYVWQIVVGVLLSLLFVAILLFATVAVVWFSNSERRIPVQYAKRVVGRKMYGGQSTTLPLKLDMAGVMPVIFASSIVSILPTVANFIPAKSTGFWGGFRDVVIDYLGPTSFPYIALQLILIFAFAYFYIAISFNPVEVSNNLRNNGGAVPGIRPGQPTVAYIKKILNRITLLGAIFLCFLSGLPMIVNAIWYAVDGVGINELAFGGTSLLIVVGVALETFRELEAQMTLRNYKGFLD